MLDLSIPHDHAVDLAEPNLVSGANGDGAATNGSPRPDPADLDDLAVAMLDLFVERRDVKAFQNSDGTYRPSDSELTAADIRGHLQGRRTLGHYVVSPRGRSRLLAFDIDVVTDPVNWERIEGTHEQFCPREAFLDPSHWARPGLIAQLNLLARALAGRAHNELKLPVAAAYSGSKGVHVYCFTGSEPAADVRDAALGVIETFGVFQPTRGNNFFRHSGGGMPLEIEVFPKSCSVEPGGYGHLLRLPLGINRKTGQSGSFLRLVAPADEFTCLDADDVLLERVLPWAT